MRRAEREVKDFGEIMDFIAEQDVLRMALTDGEGTYIVPVNYGWEQAGEKLFFYFHGAGEGRKAAALKDAAAAKATIPFEIDGRHAAIIGKGCDASYKYMSIIGDATVEILEGQDKVHGLGKIMDCIMPAEEYDFKDEFVEMTMVCRLSVANLSCKRH